MTIIVYYFIITVSDLFFCPFSSAPMVPPTLPANPVPEEDITPTSVRLVWIAIPPNDANGALTYNVTISVTGMSVDSRKKRETETNTLSQCLAAAGIDPVFSDSVPGDQTNLTLNNIGKGTCTVHV